MRNIIIDAIKDFQLNIEKYYEFQEKTQNKRDELILLNYHYHLKTNRGYYDYAHRIARVENFDVNSPLVNQIPLIPSSLFKRGNLSLLSVGENTIIKNCTSSGTLGSKSVVPRDDDTLTAFMGSITATLPVFFNMERTGNQRGYILGPTTEAAGDLWFSYVISCISLLMQTEYLEMEGISDYNRIVNSLERSIKNGLDVTIIGPPFSLLELSELIAKNGQWTHFPENSYIISAGGWKDRHKEAISREHFFNKMMSNMKISDPTAIRDSFNMVELNTVITECECHGKHVPPWVKVVIRDPKSNKALPDGEGGIISFLDASSMSYPCFILSEDIGYVQKDKCKCNREGQVLHVVRRMNNIEARGCALKLATGKEDVSNQSNRFFKSYYRA